MRLIILLLSLFLLLNLSCSKNNVSSSNTYQVKFTLDGVHYSKVYGKDSTNGMTELVFPIASGSYLACVSVYHFDDSPRSMQIQIGAIRDGRPADYTSTFASYKNNYFPGNKAFDHIGYVVQTDSEKVEINYRDENGTYWSSTTYTKNPNGGYTAIINQPTGKFTITQMWDTGNQNYLRRTLYVTGTFDCKLYEVNGPRVKDLHNGYFAAMTELN